VPRERLHKKAAILDLGAQPNSEKSRQMAGLHIGQAPSWQAPLQLIHCHVRVTVRVYTETTVTGLNDFGAGHPMA